MSDTSTSGTASPTTPFPPERSSWIGWIIFAALMFVLLGMFQVIAGIVASVNEDYFEHTTAPVFLAVDQQTWGVLQLLLGALAILTGAGLLRGNALARAVGIGVVLLGALTSLLAIGAYPVWSMLLIAVDVCILYAITVHGGDMRPSG